MSRIVTILRAAHCRSTHHYFAIDSLSRIETAPGRRLANLLLKYHDDYLIGAKAPDKTFRDFKNHVIHVTDGNWGGAPQACEKWLQQAVDDLNSAKWKRAAYACGVLSHYFTDPLMPLHTGQTKREGVIHRPLEWSVCKSYNEIHGEVTRKHLEVNFTLSSGPNWISSAVIAGATVAHQHYHRLIEIYDLEQGCRNPPQGLNEEARDILSELFAIALTGWAGILSRIADETQREIPDVSLTITALLAAVDMPLSWIVGRIADAGERRAVRAILQEYKQTGDVRKNLPAEVRSVSQERAMDAESTGSVTPSGISLVVAPESLDFPRPAEMDAKPQTPSEVAPAVRAEASVSSREAALGQTVASATDHDDGIERLYKSTEAASADINASEGIVASETSSKSERQPNAIKLDERAQTASVHVLSKLVDAPSIGPKTAKRFAKIGILTIGQFLATDAEVMVTQLNTRWINENLIRDWQDQARLVCEVPLLCGYKAQLLVAVECRSASQLAGSDATLLHTEIVKVCDSGEGQRILRSSKTPVVADIQEWISAADNHPLARRAS